MITAVCKNSSDFICWRHDSTKFLPSILKTEKDVDNGREFDVQEFCNCMNDHKVWPQLGCRSEASFRERHKLNFAGFWFTEYSWYLSYKENTPGINLSAKHPTSFYNLLREGCTKKNPEKVWSFAKPPPGPPPQFGIFSKKKLHL